MNIGTIFVGLAILILAFSYVASPFREQVKSKKKRGKAGEKSMILEDRKQQEEIVLKKLRDLDFDYQTGKVGEEDYHSLRGQLVAEAAHIIEAVQQEEAQLEQRLQARRQAKIQKEKCSTCGGELKLEDLFCPACGQPLVAACMNCGRTLHPGDLFCPGCGLPVKKHSYAVALNAGQKATL